MKAWVLLIGLIVAFAVSITFAIPPGAPPSPAKFSIVDTSNLDGVLSSTDKNVQTALETLDNQSVTVTLTAAQVKSLTTPIELVPAQGSGTLIEFVSAVLAVNYSGTGNWSESADNLVIEYASGTDVTAAIETTGFIDQTNDEISWILPAAIPTTDLVTEINDNLRLDNTGDGEFGDNGGTPTSTLIVTVNFRVIDTGL